jgi:hypothetical protein
MNVKTSEIYGGMRVQYFGNCISKNCVYQWVETFKGGRISVAYGMHSVQPSTVTCVGAKEKIYQRIRDNRIIRNDETLSEMSIAHGKK